MYFHTDFIFIVRIGSVLSSHHWDLQHYEKRNIFFRLMKSSQFRASKGGQKKPQSSS